MTISLDAPIWCIDHLAAALGATVDTARQHTYSPGFPAPRAGFSKNLWLREDVLAWFASLPVVDRSRSVRRKYASAVPSATAMTAKTVTVASKAASQQKPYKPRAKTRAKA